VGKVQSAWGIGLKADVGRGKEGRWEDGKMRRWGKSKTEGWGGWERGIFRFWICDLGLNKAEHIGHGA